MAGIAAQLPAKHCPQTARAGRAGLRAHSAARQRAAGVVRTATVGKGPETPRPCVKKRLAAESLPEPENQNLLKLLHL
jgi:hypothetical protein